MRHKIWLATGLVCISLHVHSEEVTDVICSYAPSQSATVAQIRDVLRGAAVGTNLVLLATGIKAVPHSSGGRIFTGSNGYIKGTMRGALVRTVTVKAAVIVGTTAVVVELACVPLNHPELVKDVLDQSKEYGELGKIKLDELISSAKSYEISSKEKLKEIQGKGWYEKILIGQIGKTSTPPFVDKHRETVNSSNLDF